MSKAFTREEDDATVVEDPLPPRPRDPLPITAVGREKLRAKHQAHVDNGTSGTRPARLLKSVLDTVAVKPAGLLAGGAGFGCAVSVEHEDGRRRRYELVGPDEADPPAGRISVASPLGRALLGRPAGTEAVLHKPGGDETLQVLAVEVV